MNKKKVEDVPRIAVDKKLGALIPPLSAEERAGLEESLKKEGCRDALVVWRRDGVLVLLDGHNRYEMCTRLGIPFSTLSIELPDRTAAEDWIERNQLARRNLTPDQFRYLLGRRYARAKQKHGGQTPKGRGKNCPSPKRTAEVLAEEHGVSPRTVKNAEKFAAEVDADPELKKAVNEGRPTRKSEKTQRPHVSHSTGDNEWYTPKEYIDAARDVLGEIDLDPASSKKANAVVKATRIFTINDDGLKQPWTGKVWMNPPYAADAVGKFIEKLAASVEDHGVSEALVLVNNATETKWFARLAGVASCLCFPTGRVRFWKPGSDLGAPLQGQCVAYIGKRASHFLKRFRTFGTVVEIVK